MSNELWRRNVCDISSVEPTCCADYRLYGPIETRWALSSVPEAVHNNHHCFCKHASFHPENSFAPLSHRIHHGCRRLSVCTCQVRRDHRDLVPRSPSTRGFLARGGYPAWAPKDGCSTHIKGYDVGYDMVRKNLNSETQAESHEEKSNVKWQIRQWETWVTMCIKKIIAWSYDIGF